MNLNRPLKWIAFCFLLAGGLLLPAQQPASPEQELPAIRVTTRLVLVDVIATDKDGKHVTDLKPEDFVLEDSGKKQTLSVFSLEQTAAQGLLPTLPPNIYSNRPQFNRAKRLHRWQLMLLVVPPLPPYPQR